MINKMKNAAKRHQAKVLVAAATALASGQTFALDAAQNTAITGGYTATETTVTLVVAGLLGVALLLVGFKFIMGLLGR